MKSVKFVKSILFVKSETSVQSVNLCSLNYDTYIMSITYRNLGFAVAMALLLIYRALE